MKNRLVDEKLRMTAMNELFYLLDCENMTRAKVLSNTIKQKRKDKEGKWEVPLPKVRPVAEDEMFRVVRSGKRKTNQWKRMVTKVTFVGPGVTRKLPKYERFIRPSGLRFHKAHVTRPELKCTFNLEIIGVKKNPFGPMYTSVGVVTKGTIIEGNINELGLVTPAGKVVWGKYAQVTNNPENDGWVHKYSFACLNRTEQDTCGRAVLVVRCLKVRQNTIGYSLTVEANWMVGYENCRNHHIHVSSSCSCIRERSLCAYLNNRPQYLPKEEKFSPKQRFLEHWAHSGTAFSGSRSPTVDYLPILKAVKDGQVVKSRPVKLIGPSPAKRRNTAGIEGGGRHPKSSPKEFCRVVGADNSMPTSDFIKDLQPISGEGLG